MNLLIDLDAEIELILILHFISGFDSNVVALLPPSNERAEMNLW